MKVHHIDTAEQAKLIRKALKRAFPALKFSVNISRYAGGSSVRVRWTDGPTVRMVEAVARAYQGGGFDGMIDMAYSQRAWLMPDGSVSFASCNGTAGSGGTVARSAEWMPHPDAQLVQFSGRYVFCDRDLSAEFQAQLFARLARQYPEAATVRNFAEARTVRFGDQGLDLQMLATREASRLARAAGCWIIARGEG